VTRLAKTQVMVADEMVDRGVSVRQVVRQLGVREAGLRYRLQRPGEAADGRRDRPTVLAGWEAVVVGEDLDAWLHFTMKRAVTRAIEPGGGHPARHFRMGSRR